MKAIVCDKCGKVRLLDELDGERYPAEFAMLQEPFRHDSIDLCADCYAEMVAAVRGDEAL